MPLLVVTLLVTLVTYQPTKKQLAV